VKASPTSLQLTLEKSDQQEVTLQQEIAFLRRYLEIEQIRFGDRLALRIDLDPSTLEAAVPNLILQPLVENAIRHAIEPRETAGQIELRSVSDNGRLVLQVSDNGPGQTVETPPLPFSLSPSNGERDVRVPHEERMGPRERVPRTRGSKAENQQFDLTGNAMGGSPRVFPFRSGSPRLPP
jgi:two-component sensor histidine kinase